MFLLNSRNTWKVLNELIKLRKLKWICVILRYWFFISLVYEFSWFFLRWYFSQLWKACEISKYFDKSSMWYHVLKNVSLITFVMLCRSALTITTEGTIRRSWRSWTDSPNGDHPNLQKQSFLIFTQNNWVFKISRHGTYSDV